MNEENIVYVYTNVCVYTHKCILIYMYVCTYTHIQWIIIQPLNKNEILPFVTGMDLKDNMVNDISQTEKIK